MAAQNSVNGTIATASGTSSVKCDNTSRTIAVHISEGNSGPNLGAATATTILTVGTANKMEMNQPVEVLFPVGETTEHEDGGNE